MKKSRLALTIGASVAVLLAPPGVAAGYVVHSLDYPPNTEIGFTQTELDYLAFALETDGLVALKRIPGFHEARLECLQTVGKCYQAGSLDEAATLTVKLADGTKRVTLASTSHTSEKENDYGCPGLGQKLKRLRDLVDEASKVFARGLDKMVLRNSKDPLFMAVNNPSQSSYNSFESVVTTGDHLDHLHVYEKQSSAFTESRYDALDQHTDQGLFIAIVPSLSFDINGKPVRLNDGFQVELPLPHGVSSVTIPENGDAVLFMIGDGVENWMGPTMARSLRAVPHRLLMEHANVARVWFGRMFFPPKDAYIHKQKTTFDQIRIATVQSGVSNDLGFGGCSSKHQVLRDLTDSACGANEIYCWMACRSTAGLTCPNAETIQCVNSNDGKIWTDETSHCFTCGPQCYGNSSNGGGNNIDGASNAICNTQLYPTNMYMDGFNGLSSKIPCLVFLFQSWVMDTQVKFAFGSIGAFAIGMFIEFVILLRRETKVSRKARKYAITKCLPGRESPMAQKALLVLFYATQLVFAYFAMLLAMSFSSIIFAMIMLGFVFGHVAFNFETPAGGNEACCAANDDHYVNADIVEVSSNGKNNVVGAETCCSTNQGTGTDRSVSPPSSVSGSPAPTLV